MSSQLLDKVDKVIISYESNIDREIIGWKNVSIPKNEYNETMIWEPIYELPPPPSAIESKDGLVEIVPSIQFVQYSASINDFKPGYFYFRF